MGMLSPKADTRQDHGRHIDLIYGLVNGGCSRATEIAQPIEGVRDGPRVIGGWRAAVGRRRARPR